MDIEKNEFGGDVIESIGDVDLAKSRGDFVGEDESLDDAVESVDVEEASDDEAETEEEADAEASEETNDDESGEDETDDVDDDDDDGSDNVSDDKNPVVPRTRLNKEAEKRRQAEQEVQRLQELLEKQNAQPQDAQEPEKPKELTVDKGKFEKMQLAMLDENTDEAMTLFKELMTEVVSSVATGDKGVDMEALREEVRAEMNATQERTALQNKATELFESYPELNHQGDMADETLIQEVIKLRDFNVSDGSSYVDALQDAVDYVAHKYKLEDRKAPPAKATKRVDIEAKTKVAQKERGKLKGDSNKSKDDVVDISKMSESQYEKLSDEAKRRARGDFV